MLGPGGPPIPVAPVGPTTPIKLASVTAEIHWSPVQENRTPLDSKVSPTSGLDGKIIDAISNIVLIMYIFIIKKPPNMEGLIIIVN
jgi:hypothetical protein